MVHFEHQKGMVQATDFTHHSNLFKAKLPFILGGSLDQVPQAADRRPVTNAPASRDATSPEPLRRHTR
jgi:hypothetical protein